MRITCPLLIAGMIVGSGAAVFADTPQNGKYCTSSRGYGEVTMLGWGNRGLNRHIPTMAGPICV
jgi:hypothetical protein